METIKEREEEMAKWTVAAYEKGYERAERNAAILVKELSESLKKVLKATNDAGVFSLRDIQYREVDVLIQKAQSFYENVKQV